MKTPSPFRPGPQLDDDQAVPEELTARLYQATETSVGDVVAGLSLAQRANLAMFCYHKSHLHRIGLKIAATCDKASLIAAWGTRLGQALFEQAHAPELVPVRVPHRPKTPPIRFPEADETAYWIRASQRAIKH